LFKITVFCKHERATVEKEENGSVSKVDEGHDVTGCLVIILGLKRTANNGADKHGEGVEKTITVIALVVNLGINLLVFSFGYTECNIETLNHFGEDGNEHEDLEEPKQREGRSDYPHVVGDV
jgi:hypothetical protein